MAVSGQVMNLYNYLAVLEEIIKVGNLDREIIPKEFEMLSAKFQVSKFLFTFSFYFGFDLSAVGVFIIYEKVFFKI